MAMMILRVTREHEATDMNMVIDALEKQNFQVCVYSTSEGSKVKDILATPLGNCTPLNGLLAMEFLRNNSPALVSYLIYTENPKGDAAGESV
ncbi:hypothetical protein D3C78_1810540 [compost metagenome]